MCITTKQPVSKSNPIPNVKYNPATKQHTIVNIKLNIVACPTCPEKLIRNDVVAQFVPSSVVIVTLPIRDVCALLLRVFCSRLKMDLFSRSFPVMRPASLPFNSITYLLTYSVLTSLQFPCSFSGVFIIMCVYLYQRTGE